MRVKVHIVRVSERDYRSDVFFTGDGVEEVEVDDAEVLEFLDQFDDVSFG